MFLQGQISLPLLIYNVFTWTNQSPFIDLQYFYRVKSVSISSIYKDRVKPVSFLLLTRFLQGQNSLPLSVYKNFTGSNQSPFFDLQCFYRVKSVSLFRFPRFLPGPINVLIYMMFTRYLHVLHKKIYGLFTKKIL